jgi:hypothetical protein
MTRPQIEAALKSVYNDIKQLEDEMKNIVNDIDLSDNDRKLLMSINTTCMTLMIFRAQELNAILSVTE